MILSPFQKKNGDGLHNGDLYKQVPDHIQSSPQDDISTAALKCKRMLYEGKCFQNIELHKQNKKVRTCNCHQKMGKMPIDRSVITTARNSEKTNHNTLKRSSMLCLNSEYLRV
jgi:hypothetical protein